MLTGNSLSVKSIQIPLFDGTPKSFSLFWTKFKAFAGMKGFQKALKETAEADLPESEEAEVAEGSNADKARTRNLDAMTYLTMAFTTESNMTMIMRAQTIEWPSGLAWKVVKELLEKYKPNDNMARVEARMMLNNVSMKSDDDPSVLFEQISQIQNRFGMAARTIEDGDLIATALAAAPSEYKSLLTTEQRIKGDALKLSDLEDAMRQLYRQNNLERGDKGNEKTSDEAEEIALGAFDGVCFLCQKKGHKSFVCPTKRQNNGANTTGLENRPRFTGACFNCGKQGHRSNDCWEKEENKHKRPKGFKPKETGNGNGEQGNVTVDGKSEGVELLLTCVDLHDGAYAATLVDCNVASFDVDEEGPWDMYFDDDIDDVRVVDNVVETVDCLSVEVGEVLLANLSFPRHMMLLSDPNVWLADTAATVHTTPHRNGLIVTKSATASDSITVGNGTRVAASVVGDIHGVMCDQFGVELEPGKLCDVSHLPDGKFNLFSVSRLQNEGWLLHGDKDRIWMTKSKNRIVFDIKIQTPKGAVYAMYFKRSCVFQEELANGATDGGGLKVTIEQAHARLGHIGEDAVRKIAGHIGWHITRGKLTACEACAVGKARQRNLGNHLSDLPTVVCDRRRVHLDISSIKKPENVSRVYKPHMRIIVVENMQLKFVHFFETKDGMVEPTCELFSRWKRAGYGVDIVRLDNAGENLALQSRSNSATWQLGIEFEFTARDTPQQNSLAEVGIFTLANRVRAMMHYAHVPLEFRYKLFRDCYATAAINDGLMLVELNGVLKSRFEHFCGQNPKCTKYLRTWGEAGTVKLCQKMTPKLSDRGKTCMMIGYAHDHNGDTYRMWDKDTGRVHVSRDVVWLRRMYFSGPHGSGGGNLVVSGISVNGAEESSAGESGGVNGVQHSTMLEEDIMEVGQHNADDNGTIGDDNGGAEPIEIPTTEPMMTTKTPTVATTTTRSGRVIQPPKRLVEEIGASALEAEPQELCQAEVSFLAALTELAEQGEEGLDNEIACVSAGLGSAALSDSDELGCVGAGIGGGFDHTSELHVMKFKQAMKSVDKENWEKAVDEEHERMVKHKVWQAVKRDNVPPNAKVLTSTWAMKKKSNGKFRARVNARGYEQIDGEHYNADSTAAPVVNEITIRLVFTLMVMAGWYAEVVDVRGAFLHGEFDEGTRLFMEVPEGFEKFYPVGCLLLLLQTIYGLKQAAFAFWVQLLKALRDMKFDRSNADPCLYFKWTAIGLVLWISWVDDCVSVGKKELVLSAKKGMTDRFDCDEVGELTEFVGCKLDRTTDGGLRLTQPVLLQSYVDEFDLPDGPVPVTPAEPGSVLMKARANEAVDTKTQSVYRSGVGKLIHMMKWSRPDVLNAVRDLTRHMSVATLCHLKAMKRVMVYLTATPERGLTLKPNVQWDGSKEFEFTITGFSDSDFAKDPTARKSVSGWSVFLNGAPISMRSKMQDCTTLSVTEAELVAATACAQDMLFSMRLMESIGLTVKKPMVLTVDNKGAKDLANNWSVGGRTRHIDVRYYFLRELKETGLVQTVWQRGADNCADLFTKNLDGPSFRRHVKVFCSK